jgi:hypothetical protein
MGKNKYMLKHQKARNYIFTINNYDTKTLKQFTKVAESLERHKYICYGLEVAPTTGTKHIQGYIQLDDNQAFTFLHNYFSLKKKGKKDKFHIQPANGTLKENQDYTSKASEWFEYGTPKKGGRSDLTRIKDMVRETPQDISRIIREECTNLQQLRFAENLQKYYLKPRDHNNPPKVFWIYGSTGIGKTRLVTESFESVCIVSDLKWPGDGYSQEECLLIDDYRNEPDGMSFRTLLRITDRYPYSMAVKSSSVQLNSPYIVITSPFSIDETFGFSTEDLDQLRRRLLAEINLDDEKVKNLKNYKKLESF